MLASASRASAYRAGGAVSAGRRFFALRCTALPATRRSDQKKYRYFMIPFAYQDRGNHPENSHSFISVIRVLADPKSSKLTPGLATRKYKDREFEAFTISWLPADFL